MVFGYESDVKLTQQSFDIALYTDNADPMLAFWRAEVGFEFTGAVPIDATTVQHRHRAPCCILKINVVPNGKLEGHAARGGYCELLVGRGGISSEKRLVDPDGNRILLVPPDALGEAPIGMRVRSSRAEKIGLFYQDGMAFRRINERTYTSEGSRIVVEETTEPQDGGRLRARGYRFLTFHVADVDQMYAHLLASGATSGMAPMEFGTVARIAFVRDVDGNWIELARATPPAP